MRWMETWARPARRRSNKKNRLTGRFALALSASWVLGSELVTPALHAAETLQTPIALEEALATKAVGPVRLTLVGGDVVIGRVVKVDDETLTIRRPSGGLRKFLISDIHALNIKMAGGKLVPGKITRLADGGLAWTASARTAVAESSATDQEETGGPLVRLDVGLDADQSAALEDELGEAEVDVAAIEPADQPTPAAGGSSKPGEASSGPVELEVIAEDTNEADEFFSFRLTLSEPATRSILVIYTMIDGTAKAPDDYAHRQGTVVFEPGEKELLVTTTIENDALAEGPESFQLFVSGDPKAVFIENRQIVATIEDDDQS